MESVETEIRQGRSVLKKYAMARAALVLIVGLSCMALHAGGNTAPGSGSVYLYTIFFIAFIESMIVGVVLNTAYTPTNRLSAMLLAADLVLISAIVALTGGGRSAFAFLYIAAILSASILLSLRWSLVIATAASCLFMAVSLFEYFGLVTPASAFTWLGPPMSPDEMWAYSGMKVLAFYLAAFLSGYLSRRIGMLQSIQHNILNSFPSGFISVDCDNKVTFLNSSAARLLHLPRSECLGRDVAEVFVADENDSNPLTEAVANATECQGKEVVVGRGDGRKIPVGITASPLKDGSGKPTGAVASFVDLTGMKRMEEELRRADRLAAIGEMSASLAHEIRNPVGAIRGAVQEMSENLDLDGTSEQLMKIAIRESDQLSRIITSFLEFVDTSAPTRESFEICEVLDEAVRSAQAQNSLNGRIRIKNDCPDSAGRIFGERDRIREVFINLIRNGMEAMPESGLLRVWIGEDDESDEKVRIGIQDTGVGISPGALEKVFDPFYTTKPQGIGLGMTIAHKVINGHGGSIDLESIEGSGTTVTVGLPRGI
jgi:two-component system sensor histidine kinase PilS (NtrC family)